MRYVYDTKTKLLKDLFHLNNKENIITHESVYLNGLDMKCFLLLSDQELHTYEDICKYLYDLEIVGYRNTEGKTRIIDRKTGRQRVRTIGFRMLKKLKPFEMKLECKNNVGIKLVSKEEIWIE